MFICKQLHYWYHKVILFYMNICQRFKRVYLTSRLHEDIPIPTADSSNVLIKKSRISDMRFTKQKKASGSANSENRKL